MTLLLTLLFLLGCLGLALDAAPLQSGALMAGTGFWLAEREHHRRRR